MSQWHPGLARRRRRSGSGGFVTITDTFTRANSAVSIGTATTGQTYTILGTGTWGITGNTAYRPTAGGAGKDAAVIDAGIANCTLQVTFSTHVAGSRIAFRYTDLDNGFVVQDNGTDYTLYRLQAGGFNVLGSYVVATANGAVLKATLSGDSIEIFVDGVSRITATSSFNNTATLHGLGSSDTAGGAWDDLSISA